MKKENKVFKLRTALLVMVVAVYAGSFAQDVAVGAAQAAPVFKQEDLDQMLAPLALYPDSLLSQILMASTYPLEVVQADRWVKENKNLKDAALAQALEAKPWDPCVKSLVNFPQVLDMLNAKLDWMQKLGDAFLVQPKEVMATIQNLRQKAQAEGNLKTTDEQKIIVEPDPPAIVIEPANPEVVYVPVYDPNVVYGSWWWPGYPPYYYYPPGHIHTSYGSAYAFGAAVAVGVAWGYAWGHCNWHHGDVDINIDRNRNINPNIDRSSYAARAGQRSGQWQHDASHRGGVAYRDPATAQRYNRSVNSQASQVREAYRGHADADRGNLSRGGVGQGQPLSAGSQAVRSGERPSASPGVQQASRSSQKSTGSSSAVRSLSSTSGKNAFEGIDRGSTTRQYSDRGKQSLGGASRPSGGSSGYSRPSGGAGVSRGGGGGGRRR